MSQLAATDAAVADQDPTELPAREFERAAPAWLISLGAHGLFLGAMALVVFAIQSEPQEYPPGPSYKPENWFVVPPITTTAATTTTNQPVPPAVPPDPNSQDDRYSPPPLIEPDALETTTEDDNDKLIPKGVEMAAATSNLGGIGYNMNLGAGGNAMGIWGSPDGGGRGRHQAKGHRPNIPTGVLPAVDRALRWFKRHQSPNGMWDVDGYMANCTEGEKCEPGKNQVGNADIACTGYALMCFLGGGYDHRTPGTYKTTVRKGLDYLLAAQKPDGSFGDRNYEHAIATMALAEAYGITNDRTLREPAQRAVDVILARQAKDAKADANYGGSGWDYLAPNPSRIDASVTGWNVMALKDALAAGLNVGNSLKGTNQNWLIKAWQARNPKWKTLDPYKDESYFPYVYDTAKGTYSGNDQGDGHLACVGAVCAVFLGHVRGDVMLDTLCNYIMNKNLPTAYPTNTYLLYYNSIALFQVGDERWEKWSEKVLQNVLLKAQRTGNGCLDGSWDWQGTEFHGNDTGRLLSTAYCCLSMQIYWRYVRVSDLKKAH